jgi:hypothetical protein
MRSRSWIVVLAAVAIGGCGGEPTLGTGQADRLHAQVAAVRDAAGKGDRDAALEGLDGLEAEVRDLEAAGSLAEADADALRRGIGRARRRVRAEVAEPTPAPTPVPTPTATATPAPAPAPPQSKPPKGKAPKHGGWRGNAGHGDDEDDD